MGCSAGFLFHREWCLGGEALSRRRGGFCQTGKAPLELVTIVAKAMARERSARSRTARELAEDLRRFETGKLVSAHRYSPLDLLRRFLRRYRAPLAVAAFAIAVLFVAGAWGLRKIMIARDVAEKRQLEAEAERTRASERADELTLEQARASIDRDPTRTVELLASLSEAFSDTSRARVLASDIDYARGSVAIDATHVYWTREGGIVAAPHSGGATTPIAAAATDLVSVQGRVYWATHAGERASNVVRRGSDGTVELVLTRPARILAFAIDASPPGIAWVEAASATTACIRRRAL